MGVHTYNDLVQHVGHEVEVVRYAGGYDAGWVSVAVECVECSEVLVDFDVDPTDEPDRSEIPVEEVAEVVWR